MPRKSGKHLDLEARQEIEEGIAEGRTAGEIARRVGASPSTVAREVKANRTLKERKARPGANLSVRCTNRSGCGLEGNSRDLLSVMPVAAGFQMYLAKDRGSSAAVVAAFDAIEVALGSPEAFEAVLGVVLADRGVEFDDFEGMERSRLVPGARRCRVFCCDAMATNQKSERERNHEQLRRVLPKGRSDFDALTAVDAAVLTSHVNSCPLAGRGGRCAFEIASGLLPRELLEAMGWERVPSDEVVLTPAQRSFRKVKRNRCVYYFVLQLQIQPTQRAKGGPVVLALKVTNRQQSLEFCYTTVSGCLRVVSQATPLFQAEVPLVSS